MSEFPALGEYIQDRKNKSKDPFVILKYIICLLFLMIFNVILTDLVEHFLV